MAKAVITPNVGDTVIIKSTSQAVKVYEVKQNGMLWVTGVDGSNPQTVHLSDVEHVNNLD